jgi:hypothetical protein
MARGLLADHSRPAQAEVEAAIFLRQPGSGAQQQSRNYHPRMFSHQVYSPQNFRCNVFNI